MSSFDIMVDVDDVLMPWAETVHLKCGEIGLHDGTVEWSSWHMWEDYGCSQEEWLKGVERAVADGLYISTQPLPGAVEAVNLLRWEGHRVHIVTARGFMANGEQIRAWTPQWLQEYGIGHDSLTFAKDKVDAMRSLGLRFDFAIDDGLHNYHLLDEAGVPVWLHTQPHNRTAEVERRVDSLWDFAKIVQAAHRDRTYQEVTA